MRPPISDCDELLALLVSLDGVYDAPPPEGDPVDLLQHGLQCAHELRAHHPDDVELQLAGLVHDVGHAVSDDPDHARTGRQIVAPVLGTRVAELVGLHVAAKRYLAATEDYELSEASRLSLQRQGAAMAPAEMEAFLALPLAADAIALRRADEAAKIVELDVPGLETWSRPMRQHAILVAAAQGATE